MQALLAESFRTPLESHQPLTRLDRSSSGTKKLVRIVSFRNAHVSRHLKGIHDRFNPRTEKIKAV